MIKNIVFDMGNVLIRFDEETVIGRLGLSKEDADELKKYVFESGEWSKLDDGSRTEPELVEDLKKVVPAHLQGPMEDLITGWDQYMVEIPGMYELTERLKRDNYFLYLLSNASSRQHEYWPRISCSPFFDGTVISADVKIVKPNPAIFQLFLERFDVEAASCVFIDDREENVEAAKSVGFNGVVFNGDVEKLRADLKALCVGDAV